MEIKIQDLKIGQKVWYFTKYKDLHSGVITKLKANNYPTNYHREIGQSYDEVTIDVENWRGTKRNCLCGVCAKQTMIYTSKPIK